MSRPMWHLGPCKDVVRLQASDLEIGGIVVASPSWFRLADTDHHRRGNRQHLGSSDLRRPVWPAVSLRWVLDQGRSSGVAGEQSRT